MAFVDNTPIPEREPYRDATASDLAHALCDRPTKGRADWRIPCPAHGGDDHNLSIRDLDRGPGVKCFSHGCDSREVWRAIHGRLNWQAPKWSPNRNTRTSSQATLTQDAPPQDAPPQDAPPQDTRPQPGDPFPCPECSRPVAPKSIHTHDMGIWVSSKERPHQRNPWPALSCTCSASYDRLFGAWYQHLGWHLLAWPYETDTGPTHAYRTQTPEGKSTWQDTGTVRGRKVSIVGGAGHTCLIVEGEKAAAAALGRLPEGWDVACYGASSYAGSIRLPELNRYERVVVMPDADAAGDKAVSMLLMRLARDLPNPVLYRTAWNEAHTGTGHDLADLDAEAVELHLDTATVIDKATIVALWGAGADDSNTVPNNLSGSLDTMLPYLGVEIRMNALGGALEVRTDNQQFAPGLGTRPGMGEWCELSTIGEHVLHDAIHAAGWVEKPGKDGDAAFSPLRYSGVEWRRALTAHAHGHIHHPVTAWIDSLTPWEHLDFNGGEDESSLTRRAWRMMARSLKDNFRLPMRTGATAEDHDAYIAWASSFVGLGVCFRTFVPGCIVKRMPLFVADADIGKSTSIAWAFPEPLRESLFSDNFDIDWGAKEVLENTGGRALIECSEMIGLNTKDASRAKSNLSRTHDAARMAYDSRVTSRPRAFLLVGTANQEDLAIRNDQGLFARFGVVELQAYDPADDKTNANAYRVADWWDEHREHYFAAARYLYDRGSRPTIRNRVVQAYAGDMAEEHRDGNATLEEWVAEAINYKPTGMDDFRGLDDIFSMSDLRGALSEKLREGGNQVPHRDRDMAQALRYNGMVQSRQATRKGVRTRWWGTPDALLNAGIAQAL